MSDGRTGGPALEVRAVDVVYESGFQALQDAALVVGPDERHALIGPNGAGKTTLFGTISGELRPSSGSIDVLGAGSGSRVNLVRRGVGRSFQIGRVFPSFTVVENLGLAHEAKETWSRGTWSTGRGRGRRAAAAAAAGAADAMVDSFGIADIAHRVADTLSHGEKKLLELAMTVIQEPKLLLLDEPLAGMSRDETERAITVLRRAGQDRAVLFTEHNMDAVFALADRVTVLARGTVIASGTPAEVRDDEAVREAYLGKRSGAGDFGKAESGNGVA